MFTSSWFEPLCPYLDYLGVSGRSQAAPRWRQSSSSLRAPETCGRSHRSNGNLLFIYCPSSQTVPLLSTCLRFRPLFFFVKHPDVCVFLQRKRSDTCLRSLPNFTPLCLVFGLFFESKAESSPLCLNLATFTFFFMTTNITVCDFYVVWFSTQIGIMTMWNKRVLHHNLLNDLYFLKPCHRLYYIAKFCVDYNISFRHFKCTKVFLLIEKALLLERLLHVKISCCPYNK